MLLEGYHSNMHRRRFLSAVAPAAGLVTAGCLEIPDILDDTPQADWGSFHADPGNSGFVPGHGPSGTPRISWRSSSWGAGSNPIIVDGTAFLSVGLRHERLQAVDLDAGEVMWEEELSADPEQALAYHDGLLFVGDRSINALDVETGETEWFVGLRPRSGFALDDGILVFGARHGPGLRAFEADTGDEYWSREAFTSRTPAIHDGRVYIVNTNGLEVLDLDGGDRLWTSSFDDRGEAPPAVTDDIAVIPTQHGLYAVSPDDGDDRWNLEGRFRTSPAIAEDTVVASGYRADANERAVWGLSKVDGSTQWHVPAEDTWFGHPIVAGGTVYVTSRDNRLVALDLATGERQWTLSFPWYLGTPSIAAEHVLLTVGGRLHVLAGDETISPGNEQRSGLVDPPAVPSDPGPYPEDVEFYFGSHGYDVSSFVEVHLEDDAPFSFEATIEGDTIDEDEQVTITYALHNQSDKELLIESGFPKPYGIIRLDRTDAEGPSLSPQSTGLGGVGPVPSIIVLTSVEPGETVEEQYHLDDETHAIRPGSYGFENSYTIRTEDRDASWSSEVEGRIQIEQPAPESGSVMHDVSVAEIGHVPAGFAGQFDVTALEPITDAHPGLIELTLENAADEQTGVASPGEWPFAGYVGLAADGNRAILLPERAYAPGFIEPIDTDLGEGWQADLLPHQHHRRIRGTRSFRPDKFTRMRYVVLAHPANDEPLGGRTYTFEQGYADEDVEFEWSFSLGID